jgi:hypothetical protein
MKATRIQRYELPDRNDLAEVQNAVEWTVFLTNLINELRREKWITHVGLDTTDPMGRRATHVVASGEIEV